MKLTDPFKNSESDGTRAVSPVIGVILMVAITVILAAIIGSFVLGLGGNIESTPQASFNFEEGTDTDGDVLNITHRGGDTLNGDDIEILVDGSTTSASFTDGNFSTGNTVSIKSSGNFSSGSTERVDIVFTSGDSGNVIGSYETSSEFGE